MKDLKKCDIIISIAAIIIILARFLTFFYLTAISTITKAEIETAAIILEANPLIRFLSLVSSLQILIYILLIPSILIVFYIYIREKADPSILYFYCMLIMFMAIFDLLHDASIVLGMVARNGGLFLC